MKIKSHNQHSSHDSRIQAAPLAIAAGLILCTCLAGKVNADEEPQTGAQIDKILNTALNRQLRPSGFIVAPKEIKYQDSAEYQKIDKGSTWKQAEERLGILYVAKQKPLNDKKNPKAKAIRADLIDAMFAASDLWGGGSASSSIANFAEAQTEWIIANLDQKVPQVVSDAEIKKVLPTIEDGLMPAAIFTEKINAFFASLRKVEAHLTKSQRNVLRKELKLFLKL